MSIFRIAVSGLQAAQAGLATTSHNIANVNTPGFSRQEALQATQEPQYSGGGYVGRGVTVETIIRRYDSLLVAQQRQAASAEAHQAAAQGQAAALDNLLGDSQAGLAPALDEFFRGLDQLAAQPGDLAARQGTLASAEALATRLHFLDDAIQARSTGIDRRIETTVASVNTLSTQLASVNADIAVATARGHEANDLLDLRDKLLSDLNQHVQASAVRQSDGTTNVFLSNGQALVVGQSAYALTAGVDPYDPLRRVIGITSPAGFAPLDPSTLFGGELGGLLAARRDVVDVAQNTLGRLAMSLADAFNVQHRLGQDRTGAAGGDFFAVAAPRVSASTNNTGNATLTATVTSAAQLTTSDYEVALTAGGWSVRGISDGQTQVFATLPINIDGVALSLGSGAAAVGDRYQLRPTRDGASGFEVLVSDPLRVAAGLPIRTAPGAANTGTGAISPGDVATRGANLQQPVTITFTGPATFNVSGTGTGNPTGLAYTPGMTIAYNGWSATLSGSPAAGDSFGVGPNPGGSGDNRNALALAGLRTARTVGGSASLVEEFARLVASVGTSTHEYGIAAQAQGALAAEAQRSVQSMSGVNLDEEAANLMKYQQAYQAAAKLVQVAETMFDALLALGR